MPHQRAAILSVPEFSDGNARAEWTNPQYGNEVGHEANLRCYISTVEMYVGNW